MDHKLEQRFFLGILFLATVGFLWLIMPFFAPIFWSVAIAIIFRPMYSRLGKKYPAWPNVNALLTLLTCVIIVILPAIFLVVSIGAQGVDLYQRIDSDEIDLQQQLNRMQESMPAVQSWMERHDMSMEDLPEKATEAAL